MASPGVWWLDKGFSVFDINEHVKSGMNTLTIKVRPMDILAEVEPIYLVGAFGVESTPSGWTLIPEDNMQLGSWKEQKMPFYSQSVSYSKSFEKPSNSHVKVRLREWAGTVAEVKANGKSAGIIGWAPYELEISDFLQEGENKVGVLKT